MPADVIIASENNSGRKPPEKFSPPFLWTVCALWLAVLVAFTVGMSEYSLRPGAAAGAPVLWPAGSPIQRDENLPTLIVFMHPRCPCSRATLGELALLAAHCQGRFRAQVWFLKPTGRDDAWAQTDLWQTASGIPGVAVHADVAGGVAHFFNALTSGQAVLYDPAGQLLFQGGITLARGHAGDNAGRTALEELLLEQTSIKSHQTPVFGCPLFAVQSEKGAVPCKP